MNEGIDTGVELSPRRSVTESREKSSERSRREQRIFHWGYGEVSGEIPEEEAEMGSPEEGRSRRSSGN